MSDQFEWFLPSDLLDNDGEPGVQGDSNAPQPHVPGPAPPHGFAPRPTPGFSPRPAPGPAPRSASGFVPLAPGPAPRPGPAAAPSPVPATAPATESVLESVTFTRPQRPHVVRTLPRAKGRAVARNLSGPGPQVQCPPPRGRPPVRHPAARPADVYTAAAAALHGSNFPAAGNNRAASVSSVYPQGYYHGSMTEYGHSPVAGHFRQVGRMGTHANTTPTAADQGLRRPAAQGGGPGGAGNVVGAGGSNSHLNYKNNAFTQSSFLPVAKIAKRLETELPANQEEGQGPSQPNTSSGSGNAIGAATGGYGTRPHHAAQGASGAGFGMAKHANMMQPAQTPVNFATQATMPGGFGIVNQPNTVPANQGPMAPQQGSTAPGLAAGIHNNRMTIFLPFQVNMPQSVGVLNNLNVLQAPQGLVMPAQTNPPQGRGENATVSAPAAAPAAPAAPAQPATGPSLATDNNATSDDRTVALPPKGPKAPKLPGEDQNTSVWIVHLPAGTTEKIFLDALTVFGPFGKVFSCEIIPGGPKLKHPQAACAVAFFDRASAKRLLEYIVNQKFRIQNKTIPHAYWNKKFTTPPTIKSAVSRVLIIQGDKKFADIHKLEEFLEGKMQWKTHSVEIVNGKPFDSHRTIVWTFVSYSHMAETASVLIRQGFPGLRVLFGHDPVEHGAVVAAEKTNGDIPGNKGRQGHQDNPGNQGGQGGQ